MKRGCLFFLVTWAAFSAVYWYFLHHRLPPPVNVWVPIGAGFFMAIVIGVIRTAMGSAADARRVRRALEPAGFMGEQPKDGETIVVAGTIRPLGQALIAPFSHKRAVLYSYEVERPGPQTRNQSGTVKDYAGFALTPSVIDSMRGQVKLLCFPQLEAVEKEVAFGPDAVPNATAYIRSTQWTAMDGFNPAQIYRDVKEVLTDDDGEIRKDWRINDRPDLEGATLMEQIVAPGSQVFAFGKWSAEKRGLIPDSGVPARLVVGDARGVLKSLRGKVVGNIIGALLLGGVMNAILYFVVVYGRFG
ncbi:MAG: hypothetical protein AABO58_07690 [Acidobacteriota bacterium]